VDIEIINAVREMLHNTSGTWRHTVGGGDGAFH